MADDDQDERHYHGPYKMTMFEPWKGALQYFDLPWPPVPEAAE